ncbi:hypothetical protein BCR39DRAFT_518912 [Naematelia encephala]|uniref:Signal recognition particle subunit SRP72 n=1 Tax=Naematelia encephala TaxID=71784 RepID=A0A1Y2BFX8_9TREE|nr:hypothetical protein BCR39DRAFT_518912 [Naematelia encephala]
MSTTTTSQKAKPGSVVKTHKSFTPRPPRSPEERLPRLYRSLTDQVDDGHLTNAIKTCRKILFLDPKSTSAFQTLLFLHLQIDDYTAALELLSSPSAPSDLKFERAYCLYRLHREKEAMAMLDGLEGRKVMHLEAQIRYRLGEFGKAQELYDDLLAGYDSSSPEYPDILTNLAATTAQTEFISHSFHSYLRTPAPTAENSSGLASHVPAEGELESYVPSLPTGWAIGGVEGIKKAVVAAPVKTDKDKTADGKVAKPRKTRHKLPKGAVPGKAFSEDPERWLPLRQRTSYIQAQSKKKRANQSMGVGMTQGSTASAAASGGGGGGGAKGKKGKKK